MEEWVAIEDYVGLYEVSNMGVEILEIYNEYWRLLQTYCE